MYTDIIYIYIYIATYTYIYICIYMYAYTMYTIHEFIVSAITYSHISRPSDSVPKATIIHPSYFEMFFTDKSLVGVLSSS